MTNDDHTELHGWNFDGEHILGAGSRSWTVYGWAPNNSDDLPDIEVTVRDRQPYDDSDNPLDYPRRIAAGIAAWLSLTGDFEKGQGKFLTLSDPVAPYPSLLKLADIVRGALLDAYERGENARLDIVAVAAYLGVPDKHLSAAINHLVGLGHVKKLSPRTFRLTAEGAQPGLDAASSPYQYLKLSSDRVTGRLAKLDPNVASDLQQMLETPVGGRSSEADEKGFANSVRDVIERATDAIYSHWVSDEPLPSSKTINKVIEIAEMGNSKTRADHMIKTAGTVEAQIRAHTGLVARAVHEVPEHRARLLIYTILFLSDLLDLVEE